MLIADQINNLLSDSDVASALRMLHSGGTTSLTPHYPVTHPTPSLSSASGPSRPASPPQKPKPEPYIVHAPPALLQDDQDRRDRAASVASTIAPRRERNISISSSIAPARERSSWTTRQPPTIAEKPAGRARAGSRADYDGGHVPFTHHLPTAQIDEDARSVATTETAPGTQENGSANGDHAPHRESTGLGVKEKRKEGMPKSRLSQLFHLKKKKSSDSIPSERSHRLQTPHITHAAIDEARHKLVKERPARRESEDTDRDIERRRIEKERREAELAQGESDTRKSGTADRRTPLQSPHAGHGASIFRTSRLQGVLAPPSVLHTDLRWDRRPAPDEPSRGASLEAQDGGAERGEGKMGAGTKAQWIDERVWRSPFESGLDQLQGASSVDIDER